MEDVLTVYKLPYDPQFPVICMDESNKQLVGEIHAPIPMGNTRGRRLQKYIVIYFLNNFVIANPHQKMHSLMHENDSYA